MVCKFVVISFVLFFLVFVVVLFRQSTANATTATTMTIARSLLVRTHAFAVSLPDQIGSSGLVLMLRALIFATFLRPPFRA